MSVVVWSPSGELARSGTQNIDSLIAFTTAIARWALDGIKGRCEPDFSADVYGEYYEDAMERMRVIRQEGGIRAQCLDRLTQLMLRRGAELLAHYS